MALLPTMTLFVIRASDWLTSEIPPPTPTLMELLLITLAETVGVPAAQRLMPPPSLSERFPVITLCSTCAVPAPATRMPPPPSPPSQFGRLSETVLSRIVAAENCALIPPPEQLRLPLTRLPSMRAGPPEVKTPPPPLEAASYPFRIVNPLRTGVWPAPATILTTPPDWFPSMIVAAGPSVLSTVISLSRKSIRSTYVPGETRTVSPLTAASIAAWIVGWSWGTRRTVAAAASRAPSGDNSAAEVTTTTSSRMPRTTESFIALLQADFLALEDHDGASFVATRLGSGHVELQRLAVAGGVERRAGDHHAVDVGASCRPGERERVGAVGAHCRRPDRDPGAVGVALAPHRRPRPQGRDAAAQSHGRAAGRRGLPGGGPRGPPLQEDLLAGDRRARRRGEPARHGDPGAVGDDGRRPHREGGALLGGVVAQHAPLPSVLVACGPEHQAPEAIFLDEGHLGPDGVRVVVPEDVPHAGGRGVGEPGRRRRASQFVDARPLAGGAVLDAQRLGLRVGSPRGGAVPVRLRRIGRPVVAVQRRPHLDLACRHGGHGVADDLVDPPHGSDGAGWPAAPVVVVGHDPEPVDRRCKTRVVVDRPVRVVGSRARPDRHRQQPALRVQRRPELADERHEAAAHRRLVGRGAPEVHRLVVEVDAVVAVRGDQTDQRPHVRGALHGIAEQCRHTGGVQRLRDGRDDLDATAAQRVHDRDVTGAGVRDDRRRPRHLVPHGRALGPQVGALRHGGERVGHRPVRQPAIDDPARRAVGVRGGTAREEPKGQERCGEDAAEQGGAQATWVHGPLFGPGDRRAADP